MSMNCYDMLSRFGVKIVRSEKFQFLVLRFRMHGRDEPLDRIVRVLVRHRLIKNAVGTALIQKGGNRYLIRHCGAVLHVPWQYLEMMVMEWALCEKCYLPDFSLEGRTVLDVGAGPGES
jgi:hypothetical protein